MNTDTPRTDSEQEDARNVALEFNCRIPCPEHSENIMVVSAAFARTLERENAKLKEDLSFRRGLCVLTEKERDRLKVENHNLHKLVGWSDGKLDVEELLKKRDQLKAEVEKWKKIAIEEEDESVAFQESRDQWRKVADGLAERVRVYGWGLHESNNIALSAYEKLKGEK